VSSKQTVPVHSYYQHAERAYELIPAGTDSLKRLKQAFESANEDFLAIELRTMIERLEEIEKLLADGPQG
jgi:hypothetical protein